MKESEMVHITKKIYEENGHLSAPYLQRKLKVSYTKALELISIVTNN